MELGPILRAMLRNKLRFGLTSAQVAVTLAILANCVSLILDARHKMSIPPMGDEQNLVQMFIPCLDPALRDERRADAFIQDNLARLRSFPGVRAASHTTLEAWSGHGTAVYKPVGSEVEALAAEVIADEHFVDALGVEIDEGRWFTREEVDRGTESMIQNQSRNPDGKAREPVVENVVISRAFGERVFGPGPLVGKMLEDADGERQRIIGVFRGYHNKSLSGEPGDDVVVYAGRAMLCKFGGHLKLIVRAEPGKAAAVARKIEEWHTQTYVYDAPPVWLVSEFRDVHFGRQRMTVVLLGLLIPLLLFVASLGVAGLTSISVAQRTRQIGVRRALGATAGDILRYFLIESGLVTTIGLLVGVGLAVLLNMALLRIFDGAKLSPAIVAACALLLGFVSLGAALPPALRASRVSPAIATRNV